MAITIEVKYDIDDEVYFLLNHRITKGKVSNIRFERVINFGYDSLLPSSQKAFDNIDYMLNITDENGNNKFITQDEKDIFLSREELIMSIE